MSKTLNATITITDNALATFVDKEVEKMVAEEIAKKFAAVDIEAILENKIVSMATSIFQKKFSSLSDAKVENFAKDRVSRIITTNTLKEYASNFTENDVLSNFEGKVLMMIQNSPDFKKLVINVLKERL